MFSQKNTQCFQKRIMSSLFLFLLFHPQGLKRLVSHVKCGVLMCCLGTDRLICFLMLLYCLCLSFKTSLPLAVGGCESISAVAASAKHKSSLFQAVIVYTVAFSQKKQASLLSEILRLIKGAVLPLLSVELDLYIRRYFAGAGQDFFGTPLSQNQMFLSKYNENAFMHVFRNHLSEFQNACSMKYTVLAGFLKVCL